LIKFSFFALLLLLVLTSLGTSLLLTLASGYREILRTSEKELRVNLESALGKVYVSKGDPRKICTVSIKETDGEKGRGKVSYRVEKGVGDLDLELTRYEKSRSDDLKDEDFKLEDLEDLESGKWYIRFTDAIPISFNVELGLGAGDFDCSGLMIKDFKMSTGASSVRLRFREPNKTALDYMKIETGVSKFVGEGLGYANIRRLDFSGGVGSYTLDFGGSMKENMDVKVEVGLGAVTLQIPREVGVRIQHEESWVSKIDVSRDMQRKQGFYISDNYSSAASRMNIKVESGFGHVRIRRTWP